MHPIISITPNVVDTPIGSLTPGTWGVLQSPRSPNTPSIVVLCIEQIEHENATQILFFGPDPLGIFSIARQDLQVLAITDHVDVKIDPKAMTRLPFPDPESHTSVLFALDSEGPLFLTTRNRQYGRFACAIRPNDLEIVDLPTRAFWTSEFDLRTWCNQENHWDTVASFRRSAGEE